MRATAEDGAAFIPFGPLGAKPMEPGAPLAEASSTLANLAREAAVRTGQLTLAWLLYVSPNTIVIPATTRIPHLEENVAARDVRLGPAQMDRLDALDGAA